MNFHCILHLSDLRPCSALFGSGSCLSGNILRSAQALCLSRNIPAGSSLLCSALFGSGSCLSRYIPAGSSLLCSVCKIYVKYLHLVEP